MRYVISPASDCTSVVDGIPDPVEAGAAGTLGPWTTRVWPEESVAVSDPSNGDGTSNSDAGGEDTIVPQLVTADNLLTKVVIPSRDSGVVNAPSPKLW